MLAKSIRQWSRFMVAAAMLVSCAVQKKIAKDARQVLLQNPALATAHIGIALYDVANKKYVYKHDANKYFVPASNTKLLTCYAALKYLGDSIVAAKYMVSDSVLYLQSTGDPTLLHPDFKQQALLRFVQQPQFKSIELSTPFDSKPLGFGWAWDDFTEPYMAERDPMPMYGNVLSVTYAGDTLRTIPGRMKSLIAGKPLPGKPWSISRNLGGHFYTIDHTKGSLAQTKTITMAMDRGAFAEGLLSDAIARPVTMNELDLPAAQLQNIYSQSTDSLLKITMHRSDNFFAEQVLLMVSQARLGTMNDQAIIDTLLATDLAGMPEKPKWVDGSGLSRYNLVSPQDFVWLLTKMHTEFGNVRLATILPGANEGTLSNLYKGYGGKIFAKTGTLSNHVALSGMVNTHNNRQLIFSILVNHHQTTAAAVRKAIEQFITRLIDTN